MFDDGTDTDAFLRELHDALVHLRNLAVRQSHPLGELLSPSAPLSPAVLRQNLLDGIERLRPPPHVAVGAPRWRRYRYLRLRYVEGATLEQVSAELGIGERQARREHHTALQELATILLERAPTNRPAEARDASRGDIAQTLLPADTPDPASGLSPTELETELTQLETEPELEPIDLGVAVEDATRLVERLATGRAIELDGRSGPTLTTVIAMRTVLRQVLLNLLSYAIGLESTTRVSISTQDNGTSAEIRLVAEARDRGDSQAKPDDGEGRGVSPITAPALTAARRLAEAQEGVLRVETTSGGDTIIRLFLLTARATLVLVVDDNPDVVRLFRRYLRGEGFRLVQARNGFRAQQLARTLRPDVVILDLMMPVQDGWDLFRALRDHPSTAGIPIIACSVLPERELALSLEASDFLAKPVTPESLRAALVPYQAT